MTEQISTFDAELRVMTGPITTRTQYIKAVSLADHLAAMAKKDEQVRKLRNTVEAQLSNMACICRMLHYTGKEPPCETCKLRAALEATK